DLRPRFTLAQQRQHVIGEKYVTVPVRMFAAVAGPEEAGLPGILPQFLLIEREVRRGLSRQPEADAPGRGGKVAVGRTAAGHDRFQDRIFVTVKGVDAVTRGTQGWPQVVEKRDRRR